MSAQHHRRQLSFDPNSKALESLATPALVLDGDALDRNLERMNSLLERHESWARPHTKTHKCAQIARRQMSQSRTLGLCCARVSEAEAMVAAGVEQILVTSPVVTAEKLQRLVRLVAKCATVEVVVDSSQGVARLAAEASRQGVTAGVYIDLDPGFHRTGIAMGAPAVGLAEEIDGSHSLRLRGAQMYAGTLMHLQNASERRSRSRDLWEQARSTVQEIRALGIECETLTGGGTGTYDIDAQIGIADDLQVGSYVFMDAQYRVIETDSSEGADDAAPFDFFEPSLFVVASAVSQSVPRLITVDAGLKAMSCDHTPEVVHERALRYHFAGDEHGMIELDGSLGALRLGQRVALLVSHCDPTVNLHDHYDVVRDGEVVEQWPVLARGIA